MDGRESETTEVAMTVGNSLQGTHPSQGSSVEMGPLEGKMSETSRSMSISTKQQRIAKLAQQMPEKRLTTLAHHVDNEWLKEAHRRTRRHAAAGVDGQTAAAFEEHLDENVRSLLERARNPDRYRAPPVRRVEIPKNAHETRPLGIPTHEDKVLQRAVVMLLEPVYEQDFLPCSFGFRPGRSPHQALRTTRDQLASMQGGWLIDLDIRRFFDSVDPRVMQDVLRRRIGDGVVLRLIGKWLRAGVMIDSVVAYPDRGTPQGGVVSPLLANILLHDVLDRWFEEEVRPRMRGRSFLVRFADDAVFGFEFESDAKRVYAVIGSRLERFGLTMHPDKTRLVCFKRPPRMGGGGGSFDFLGLTFYWGRSRNGARSIKVKTAKDRHNRALCRMNLWLRSVRHWKIKEQHRVLVLKLRGHYAYYAVSDNWRRMNSFVHQTRRLWYKWLNRRHQRRAHDWDWFQRLTRRFPLPSARLVFSMYT